MLGHETVTAMLTNHVREYLPLVMQRRMAITKPDLPVTIPEKDHIYPFVLPHVAIGAYPCLFVEEMETGPRYTTKQTSAAGDVDEFEFRYVFRVWCFVNGTDYQQTAYQQKYLATSLRIALLKNRRIHETDDEKVVVDVATFRESLSGVDNDEDSNKFLAGFFTELELVATETMHPTELPPEIEAMFTVGAGLMRPHSTEPIPPTTTPLTGTE